MTSHALVMYSHDHNRSSRTGHGCATLNQPDIDETRTCGEYARLIRTSSSQTEWIQNSAASEIQLENRYQKGRPAEKSERSTKDYFWNKPSRRTIGQYTNRMLGITDVVHSTHAAASRGGARDTSENLVKPGFSFLSFATSNGIFFPSSWNPNPAEISTRSNQSQQNSEQC